MLLKDRLRKREKPTSLNSIPIGKSSVTLRPSIFSTYPCFVTGCDEEFRKTCLLLEHVHRSHSAVVGGILKAAKIDKEQAAASQEQVGLDEADGSLGVEADEVEVSSEKAGPSCDKLAGGHEHEVEQTGGQDHKGKDKDIAGNQHSGAAKEQATASNEQVGLGEADGSLGGEAAEVEVSSEKTGHSGEEQALAGGQEQEVIGREGCHEHEVEQTGGQEHEGRDKDLAGNKQSGAAMEQATASKEQVGVGEANVSLGGKAAEVQVSSEKAKHSGEEQAMECGQEQTGRDKVLAAKNDNVDQRLANYLYLAEKHFVADDHDDINAPRHIDDQHDDTEEAHIALLDVDHTNNEDFSQESLPFAQKSGEEQAMACGQEQTGNDIVVAAKNDNEDHRIAKYLYLAEKHSVAVDDQHDDTEEAPIALLDVDHSNNEDFSQESLPLAQKSPIDPVFMCPHCQHYFDEMTIENLEFHQEICKKNILNAGDINKLLDEDSPKSPYSEDSEEDQIEEREENEDETRDETLDEQISRISVKYGIATVVIATFDSKLDYLMRYLCAFRSSIQLFVIQNSNSYEGRNIYYYG